MSKNGVVETFNENGEPEQFRAFSSRLQEFLEEFKPQDGYRMVVTASDSLSSMPGLASLYRTAIEAGKNPVDVGLPDLTRFARQIVFRAELLDDNGQIVSSASSFCEIEHPDKTWEIMETSARSRLMASLGVGYELLDADEGLQIDRQQHRAPRKTKRTSVPSFSPVEEQSSELEPEQAETVINPQEEPEEVEQTAEASDQEPVNEKLGEGSEELFEPVTSSESPAASERLDNKEQLNNVDEFPFAADAKEKISESVLRQIKTLSINKNEKVNPVLTNAEARTERKRLMTA